jgi:hypothetical protein
LNFDSWRWLLSAVHVVKMGRSIRLFIPSRDEFHPKMDIRIYVTCAPLERIERLERFERSVTLNDLNEAKCLNRLNGENLVHRSSAQPSSMSDAHEQTRVGEIKLEEIIDRSIVRKLDDSGFIDRAFAAAGVK